MVAIPLILALGRQRQKDHFKFKIITYLHNEFQGSPGYTASPYLKKAKEKRKLVYATWSIHYKQDLSSYAAGTCGHLPSKRPVWAYSMR